MATILITGIGLTSRTLGQYLVKAGYDVHYLSRSTQNNFISFKWNISKGYIDMAAFENVTHVIHLAGAGIGDKRWSRKRKHELIESRITSTQILYKAIKKHNIQLNAFIATSAIGYYGAITRNKLFTETDSSANDFLGDLCKQWENSIQKIEELNIRTIIFRTGIVFTRHGGALQKITSPIKNNIGAVLGNGNQIVPWIHIDDLCQMYLFAINNTKIVGIYNAVSPAITTNRELTHAIAKTISKHIWLPRIPIFIVQLLFGEMSQLLLFGSAISSKKIHEEGFKFKFDSLAKTLKDLLSR